MSSRLNAMQAERNGSREHRSDQKRPDPHSQRWRSSPPDPRRPPPTRLGVFAAGSVECAWLAALVVVPSFFNLYTEWQFEEEKVLLLRSFAIVVLIGALVLISGIGGGALA